MTIKYCRYMTAAALTVALSPVSSAVLAASSSAVIQLYVDTATQQIFTAPGEGRVHLGSFKAVDEGAVAADSISSSAEQRLVDRQQAFEEKVVQSLAAKSGDASISLGKKGLEVEDDNFSMALGGRLHADWTAHNGDNDLEKEATSGTDIRRARISMAGTAYRDFKYKIEGDWAGNNVSMKDMFLQYNGFEGLEIVLGNTKHAMSMELEESSNDIMFNERSLLSALTTPNFDRALGLNLKTKGDNWSLQGGVYGDPVSPGTKAVDEGQGWAVRGTWAPVNTADRLLHLGINYGQRDVNNDGSLSASKEPRFRYETTAMSDLYLSDSGVISDFEDIGLTVFEAAAKYGAFSIQGEYGSANVGRELSNDVDFDAWYMQVGWSLTGESRNYKGSDGEFKRLKPAHLFDPAAGTWGAWELALRYDEIDLEDADIFGGHQDRLSVNLNWYLNESMRILFGFSRVLDVNNGPVLELDGSDVSDLDIFSMRTQWAL